MKYCECRRLAECYGGVVNEIKCVQSGANMMARMDHQKERQFEVTSDELPPTVDQTLVERKARYGDFSTHAIIAQDLQTYMRSTPGWAKLSADKRQALTTITDKIARILNGDPEYTDNWHDIAGYAKLAEDRCRHGG